MLQRSTETVVLVPVSAGVSHVPANLSTRALMMTYSVMAAVKVYVCFLCNQSAAVPRGLSFALQKQRGLCQK
jgi:hypothetical protein